MSEKIKVFMVEDDPDFVYLVSKMIKQDDRFEWLGSAANKADGISLAQKLRPDIVLMDLNLSGDNQDGIQAAKAIRVTTDAKIILFTASEQQDIIIDASKKSFASGYVFKSAFKGLADTIYNTAVSSTPQEQMIIALILKDLSPAEKGVLNMIVNGTALRSAAKTILNQRGIMLGKLGLGSPDELVHIFKGQTISPNKK